MNISVENKLSIHELLGRAAYAYDESNIKLLEASFSENASFTMRIAGGDLVGPFEGRVAIIALMTKSMAEQTDVRRHIISNIFFEDSDIDIKVISNLTLIATEKGKIKLLTTGIYYDTVVIEGGDYRLARRHIELDKSY
jgi:3-phenylpropionate/cinnamic acid dioxygenase small subunit